MSGYLARFGESLVKNGYPVIPIMPGTKHPPNWMTHKNSDSWSKIEPSIERVQGWKRDSRLAEAGVGINLGRTLFAIDSDILDPGLAAAFGEWCDEHLPSGPPQRIGLAPKSLRVFRVDTPIKKVTSKAFNDAKGRKCQVEGLGEGEQFVAYAVHPETKQPYTWPESDLIDTPYADLPLITVAHVHAARDAFEKMCVERGLVERPRTTGGLVSTGVDVDDWTGAVDFGKTDLTDDQLKEYVNTIPNHAITEQDFDTWLQVGMAVYHQTDGSDEGFDIWNDWSGQSTKHVKTECERRWKSFDVSAKDRRPITAKWLIKVANEIRDKKIQVVVEDIRQTIEAAGTEDALRAAAKKAKGVQLDKIERDLLATVLQRRIKSVTNASVPIGVVRDMLRYEAPDKPEMPPWLVGWVFISTENVLFDRTHSVALKPEAFDAAYARLFLSMMDRREGRAIPEKRPSDMALNVFQIPVVARRVYLPSEEPAVVVKVGGVECVNTYSKAEVPEPPGELTAKDRENLDLIQRHFAWLIRDARELALFLTYLSCIAKSERVRWAVVLHGNAEGAGKTFVFVLMGHVLGQSNVRMVAPKELEREFTGWAEGAQFICLEEIKLHGHNRYDIMNSLKPLITNDYVSVRRMRTDSYMAPNTASYLALTNFADALPLTDQDRRYMLISAAPTKADIAALPKDYFDRLFTAAKESAGAIRVWLRGIEPHPDFNASGRAPATIWKDRAVEMSESDEATLIRGLLDQGATGVSRTLLSAKMLADALMEAGEGVPMTRALNRALMDVGLTFIGRVRIDGVLQRLWAEDPARWMKGRVLDIDAIREWLADEL